jgi:hypothetical protein
MKEDCMKEDAIPKRPWTVTTAVYVLYLGLGIWAVEWWLKRGSIGSVKLADWITLLVFGLIYYMIGRGRNWGRIAFLIIILVTLPVTILSVAVYTGRWVVPGPLGIDLVHPEIIQIGIQSGALVLLFLRPSSHWFKTMKTLHAKGKVGSAQ